MVTNNALDLSSQGVAYYNGTGTFSGLDASTTGFVLTSNGTGVAPSFQASGGGGGGGSPVQQTRGTTTTNTSTATTMPIATTPQNTDGVQVLTATITPTNASHILIVEYNFWITFAATQWSNGGAANVQSVSAIFQDATAAAKFAQIDDYNTFSTLLSGATSTFTGGTNVKGRFSMTTGTTSATTLKVRIGLLSGSNAGTLYFLQDPSANKFGGVIQGSLTLTEWTA